MTEPADRSTRVVLIYNADGTVMGKLRYAYKKLFPAKGSEQASPKQSAPVCGNCDITHGGLSLTETSAWTAAKAGLQSEHGIAIAQLHRDELDERLKSFIKNNAVRLPTVLLDDGNDVREIVQRDQINVCALGRPGQAGSLDEQRAALLVDSIESALRERAAAAKL